MNHDSSLEQPALSPEDVLDFWFGPSGSSPLLNSSKWYMKDEAFDDEIRARFGDALDLAARGGLAGWRTSRRGRLAHVILLDQFSRNIYRNDPRAFAQDARARSCAFEAFAAGDERSLGTIERSFLYMPLMHAEDVDLQHQCVAKFDRLRDDAPAELRGVVEGGLDYARRHADIIERFGRFPHRNAILGRPSTAEELAFLKQPGSSF